MKLIFMGTPEFAVPTLRALAAEHEVCAVYTQPPRPAGRGQRLTPSPVARVASELGLSIRHPLNFKDSADVADFAALGADLAVVVAYGLILPRAVLAAPRLGCVNGHASLLPRWRGAAPIQRAIMAGDAETGTCAMKMTAGLDTGPVWHCLRTPIAPDDTLHTLHDRLSVLTAQVLMAALPMIAAGVAPVPQSETGVVYASKIDKAEGRLDWNLPAITLDRLIRGLGAGYFMLGAERIKVLAAEIGPATDAAAGTVIGPTTIACGEGSSLRLTRLQRPGKGPVSAAEFVRAMPLPPMLS